MTFANEGKKVAKREITGLLVSKKAEEELASYCS